MAKVHAPGDHVTDANVALQYLKEGNERFVKETPHKRDFKAERDVVKNGQKPFAIILTCADSRTPPEIFFDQGLGDIFVLRNAGNFADDTAMGSIEFAVEHLKAVLCVVVGHNECGAVNTAFADATGLAGNLQSALDAIKTDIKGSGSKENAMDANVESQVKKISENAVVKKFGAKVMGAIYDIGTGVVTFK